MNRLLRASTLIGQPVVTVGGESPLEIKDVVFEARSGKILGFRLRKHGFLGGPVDEFLAWSDVHGLGPDAVVIDDPGVLDPDGDPLTDGGDTLSDRVLTESGVDLGEVVEVIVRCGARAEVVGFEIEPGDDRGGRENHNLFIPLPDTLGISEENIIVPDAATEYVRNDLSGFGGAVEQFRANLSTGSS